VRNNDTLIRQIAQNDKLQPLRDKLAEELAFRSGYLAQFDPMLILTAISIIVQIILACRNKHSDEQLCDAIRNAKTLPRWRVLLMRRKLNNLWADYCVGDDCNNNILYDALLEIAENSEDEEITEILRLASGESA